MAAINPFYNVRQSQRVSNFVDESIPAELMLRAGMAKQNQQDEIMNLVNQTGMFDANSIKGGDTDLINQTKERVNKFVDENSGKDLTNPQSQQQVYRFARELAQDKKIKQVEANYNKVQQMNATIAKLKAAGNQAFDPSIKLAQRKLQEYTNNPEKMGEDFGSLDIEKALDLHKKEQTYFDQMKANGGESFSENIKALQNKDMFGKNSTLSISEQRIVDRARSVAQDYASTPEGEQALAIYREKVLSGEIDPNEKSGGEYLAERLIRTGDEFSFERNSKQAISNPAAARKNAAKKAQEPNYIKSENPGQIENVNYDELKKRSAEGDVESISTTDRMNNEVLRTPEGKERGKKIHEISESIIKRTPTAEKMMEVGELKRFVSEPESKEFDFITQNIYSPLSKELPNLIKEEIDVRHNSTFAKALDSGELLNVNKKGTGISVVGTDKVFLWEDLNVDPEKAKEFFDVSKNTKGTNNKLSFNRSLRASIDLYNKGVKEKTFTEDGVKILGAFDDDFVDQSVNLLKEEDDQKKKLINGDLYTPSFNLRPETKTERTAISGIMGSANPDNFTIIGENNEIIKDNNFKLSDLISNEEGKNINYRINTGDRSLEVTRTIGDNKVTFTIREKPGVIDESFDRLYKGTGDPLLGRRVGALGNLKKFTTNNFSTSENVLKGFKDIMPNETYKKTTIKINPEVRGGYILGDENAVEYTNFDYLEALENANSIQDKEKSLDVQGAAYYKQAHKNRYIQALESSGVSRDSAEDWYSIQYPIPGEESSEYLNAFQEEIISRSLEKPLSFRTPKELEILSMTMNLSN